MLRLLVDLVRGLRLRRALRAPQRLDRCVACDGADVEPIAEGAYRCRTCGHEGGDGLAAYRRALRHAAFAAMPADARRASAGRDLLAARTLVLSALGDLHEARRLANLDLLDLGSNTYGGVDGEGHEKQRAITASVGLLLEAREHADDAAFKLQRPIRGAAFDPDHRGEGVIASLDLHLDGILTDAIAREQLLGRIDRANAFLAELEALLAREFPDLARDG